MDFIPHDNEDIEKMLKAIGIHSIEELFKDIPGNLRINGLNLPSGISEPELFNELEQLSKKNKVYSGSFLGAGCYYHFIPSLVEFIVSRSEFYTSYTPYQAEASQGLLQALFEYQSAISRLTKMEVSNASTYDGSMALAEAAIMSCYITGRNKILIHNCIHPEYIEVVKTYCWGHGMNCEIVSDSSLFSSLSDKTAAVLFQSPNFYGEVENIKEFVGRIRKKKSGCLIIQTMTDPTCLGILTPPGDADIDIFVAEGQSLGLPPSFGGPGLGIFTTKNKYLRKIPGRLVGQTREINGNKIGYILTLQAREQHVRREKATSNICTNQALCALASLIYIVSLGGTGLREVAIQNIQKANYVKKKISKINGFKVLNQKPIYNEFVVKCPNVEEFKAQCKEYDLLPPLDLSYYYPDKKDLMLTCVTEINSKENIDTFLTIAKNLSQ